MIVRATLAGLKKTKPWELALRFAFGGALTVVTGLVAKGFGPAWAGLFLAFPAILPVSLTRVRRHDGRGDAADEAKGAAAASSGLVVFGALVWYLSGSIGLPLLLLTASVGWLVTATTLWWLLLAPKGRAVLAIAAREAKKTPRPSLRPRRDRDRERPSFAGGH